jgi:hypothetical protein
MAKNKTAAMRAVVTAAHRGAELSCDVSEPKRRSTRKVKERG